MSVFFFILDSSISLAQTLQFQPHLQQLCHDSIESVKINHGKHKHLCFCVFWVLGRIAEIHPSTPCLFTLAPMPPFYSSTVLFEWHVFASMDRHDSSRNQIEEGLSKMIYTQGSLFCGQLRNSVRSPQQVWMMTAWISSLGKGNAKANLSWRAASNIDHNHTWSVSSECEEKTKIKVSHHGENSDIIRAFQTAHKIFHSWWTIL